MGTIDVKSLSFDRGGSSQLSGHTEKNSRDIDTIVREAQEFLQQKVTTKTYREPIRSRIYYEILTPHANASPLTLVNIYLEDLNGISYPPKDIALGQFVIIHGHNSGGGCFGPNFCHVLGYTPTGEEHPSFLRAFYQKWPQLR